MKIAYVYNSKEHSPSDAINSAVALLGKAKWSVHLYDTAQDLKPLRMINVLYPDLVLVRSKPDSPEADLVKKNFPAFKKAILSPTPFDETPWSLVFTESFVSNATTSRIREVLGINTNLFRPFLLQPKVFDCIYVAPFTRSSNHPLFADYCKKYKLHGLAVGRMDPNEPEAYEVCLKAGLAILPEVPSEALVWLYNASKSAVVCSEQVQMVLEARACNVPVVILDGSERLQKIAQMTREEVGDSWAVPKVLELLDNTLRGAL